jgi:hypothetical protein
VQSHVILFESTYRCGDTDSIKNEGKVESVNGCWTRVYLYDTHRINRRGPIADRGYRIERLALAIVEGSLGALVRHSVLAYESCMVCRERRTEPERVLCASRFHDARLLRAAEHG